MPWVDRVLSSSATSNSCVPAATRPRLPTNKLSDSHCPAQTPALSQPPREWRQLLPSPRVAHSRGRHQAVPKEGKL